MTEHLHTLIPITVLGVDISITPPVVIMWGTCLLIFTLLLLANQFKRVREVQTFFYEFVCEAFASNINTTRRIWFSFLITLFLFVFFNNISGLIPGGEAPTSNINVTGALAIMVFLLAQVCGFLSHGLHHIKHLVPTGTPVLLMPIIVPLEIVSHLARPFSLAVRLFANMFAGHMVLTIFIGFAIMVPHVVKVLPFTVVVLVSLFEIFVAFIQSYIFTYLASFYISDAVSGSH
jgi:F-type H+-transporting ATPase subunit a